MDQNTRVFYGNGDEYQEEMNGDSYAPQQPYQEEYNPYEGQAPEDDFAYDGDENGDYSIYDEEDAGGSRFKVAMGVFDMASVLMGVVVILALTTLIVSMVSWLRTDIMHSFVLLQSRIQ